MSTASPGRLPSSIPSSAYLRSEDKHALELERVELYVVHVDTTVHDEAQGGRVLLWLVADEWDDAERVLDFAANEYRRKLAADLATALRRSRRVGPYRLKLSTARSGHPSWLLVSPEEADSQLELGGDAAA